MDKRHILSFWFENPSKWYNGGDAFDALVREKFEDFTIDTAAGLRCGADHYWQQSPDGLLALIITLDQFPRNMFRGTKGAFAFDPLALALARKGVSAGFDLKIGQEQRAFIYMPFMHAEDILNQEKCVQLFDQRIDSASSLRHAKAHHDLIERFGRFPHRNKILGRAPTQEEIDFLHNGGYSP